MIAFSRPRFWHYVFGPYLIGFVATYEMGQVLPLFWLLFFGFYFLYPANLLVYGANDLADRDTDAFNEKKDKYERRAGGREQQLLLNIFFWNLPFLLLSFWFFSRGDMPLLSFVGLIGFWFFGLFYSLPPVRAKAIPFVDGLFNVLYVFPALVSLGFMGTSEFPVLPFLAALLWCMAMHAYSAIPDIRADKRAGLKTVATLLGPRGTLFYCAFLYGSASVLMTLHHSYIWLVFGSVYLSMMQLSLEFLKKPNGIFSIYRYFPLVNAFLGFLIFWLLLLD